MFSYIYLCSYDFKVIIIYKLKKKIKIKKYLINLIRSCKGVLGQSYTTIFTLRIIIDKNVYDIIKYDSLNLCFTYHFSKNGFTVYTLIF